jgi:hypothetical protein
MLSKEDSKTSNFFTYILKLDDGMIDKYCHEHLEVPTASGSRKCWGDLTLKMLLL